MATMELDPLFVKGLRLLHSKSKDSTEQLKQLLDEVISQSKQSTYSKERTYTSVKCEDSKIHIKKASRETPELTSFSSKYSTEDAKERKAEKKQAEKPKQDIIEIEAKIPKLEPPQGYSYYPSSPPDLPKLDQYIPKKDDDTDSSDENTDADDFAMEMGLACVICKSLDVTQGNQLIECQECHNLYHQECHKPPATDDYNDPRRVWYCAKCVKNMKKITTKTQKTAKTGVSVSSKEASPQPKSTRSEGSPPATMLPFKRSELKTISGNNSSNQTTANKPIGLAGLAANFGGGRSTATSAAATTTTRGASKNAAATGVGAANLKSAFSAAGASGLLKLASAPPATTTSQAAVATSAAAPKPPAMKGLGLLSAAVASGGRGGGAPAAGGGGSGNGHSKAPSCSPLMSADKRLQIMKKKASKMHEKRRLSNK